MIDFTEIPSGNTGGLHQDLFEQFCSDFLQTIGFIIVRAPNRGADGGKDLIVREKRPGVTGDTTIDWLVSCKHFAQSNSSVSERDEINILERVRRHKCNGFMGVYSTIPSAGLSDCLAGLQGEIQVRTFDGAEIERRILSKPYDRDRILASYFPLSHEKYRGKLANDDRSELNALPEDVLLRVFITAQIILEIDKIKEEYGLNNEWRKRYDILRKLYKYSDHSNEKVASHLFPFLVDVSYETRHEFPEEIAEELESLIISYFPFSFNGTKDKMKLIENGRICVYIGFNIAYNSFIHTGNFRAAQWGLSIIKYIYRYAKQHEITELTSVVYKEYASLEDTLRRPERNDLGNAQEFTQIFKRDLDNQRLETPDMPEHLYKLIEWRGRSSFAS
ncbi:MAG: restriction endonuclease [Bacteroidetes bacterium]|nr:restriction endonuclease [Bacteroidota bacterium]